MAQDDTTSGTTPTRTPTPDAIDDGSHPSWCHPEHCTVAKLHPYGWHSSPPYTVGADEPVTTAIQLQLTELPSRTRRPLATIELAGVPHPELCPLTPDQVRQLHHALAELVSSLADG
jgi:hypothetical protein